MQTQSLLFTLTTALLATIMPSTTSLVAANKMTPIFGTVAPSGQTSCSGQTYDAGTLYVAVDPSLFVDATACPISSTGTGYAITIECNGLTVQAQANDKCMGCTSDWIDVAPAVWEACGYSVEDIDPKEIAFTLS